MPDYSYPSWLTPKSEPWQALVAGVQAGSQIAATRQRAQQMYAQAQQFQARQDLDERQFVTQNEAATLHNEILRNKFASDAADLSTMREWFPQFSASTDLEGVSIPTFNNPMTTRAMSELYMQKRKTIGEGKMAGAIADSVRNGFKMDDPETLVAIGEVGSKWPEVVGSPGWNKTLDFADKSAKASALADYHANALAERVAKRESMEAATSRKLDMLGAHYENQDEAARLKLEMQSLDKEQNQTYRAERLRQIDEQADRLQESARLKQAQFEERLKTLPPEKRDLLKDEIKRLNERADRGEFKQKTSKGLLGTGIFADSIQYGSKYDEERKKILDSYGVSSSAKPDEASVDVLMFDAQGNKVRVPRTRMGEFGNKGYRMAQ